MLVCLVLFGCFMICVCVCVVQGFCILLFFLMLVGFLCLQQHIFQLSFCFSSIIKIKPLKVMFSLHFVQLDFKPKPVVTTPNLQLNQIGVQFNSGLTSLLKYPETSNALIFLQSKTNQALSRESRSTSGHIQTVFLN